MADIVMTQEQTITVSLDMKRRKEDGNTGRDKRRRRARFVRSVNVAELKAENHGLAFTNAARMCSATCLAITAEPLGMKWTLRLPCSSDCCLYTLMIHQVTLSVWK
jgi:hypothetical protein